jgi:hypothetical protein
MRLIENQGKRLKISLEKLKRILGFRIYFLLRRN